MKYIYEKNIFLICTDKTDIEFKKEEYKEHIDKLKKIFGITDIPDQETAQTELDNLLTSVYEKLQNPNSKVISNIIRTNNRDLFEHLVDRKIEF